MPLHIGLWVCVYVRVCVCAHEHVCVCVCKCFYDSLSKWLYLSRMVDEE